VTRQWREAPAACGAMISATLLPGEEERTSLLSSTARTADSGYGCGHAEYDAHNGVELAETAAPPLYRDVPWAVLFLLHWITLIWLGVWVAPKGYDALDAWDVNMTDFTNELKQNEDDVLNEDTVVDFESFMDQMADFWPVYPLRVVSYLILPGLMLSFLVSFMFTAMVIRPHALPFVYSTMAGSVIVTAIVAITWAVMSRSALVWFLAIVALCVVGYFIKESWRLVPFTAINLKVALTGISINWGMYLIALFFSTMGFLWNIYWLYILVGLSATSLGHCDDNHNSDADHGGNDCDPPILVILLLMLSLYWTSTVIMVRFARSAQRDRTFNVGLTLSAWLAEYRASLRFRVSRVRPTMPLARLCSRLL
jgi:Plasma-membrane choline transporter